MERYNFSQLSERNLSGVHPDLCTIMRKTLTLSSIDFGISEGVRSKKRQLELLAQGKSLTSKSRHITGHAVDIFAVPNGTVSWDFKYYEMIADIALQVARDMSVNLEWGGHWDDLKDGVHFQLSRKSYP